MIGREVNRDVEGIVIWLDCTFHIFRLTFSNYDLPRWFSQNVCFSLVMTCELFRFCESLASFLSFSIKLCSSDLWILWPIVQFVGPNISISIFRVTVQWRFCMLLAFFVDSLAFRLLWRLWKQFWVSRPDFVDFGNFWGRHWAESPPDEPCKDEPRLPLFDHLCRHPI